jgi:hypothetical protein
MCKNHASYLFIAKTDHLTATAVFQNAAVIRRLTAVIFQCTAQIQHWCNQAAVVSFPVSGGSLAKLDFWQIEHCA